MKAEYCVEIMERSLAFGLYGFVFIKVKYIRLQRLFQRNARPCRPGVKVFIKVRKVN